MIRAVLVDDEPPARVRMRQLLEAAGGVTVVGEAGSAVEARDVIRDTRPDLLFLDVEMPEVRGTALAASLPEPRPFIVFATAFESYALDAIAVDATDYLLKPVSRLKLAATLDRVRARLAKQSDLERDVAAGSAVQSQMWPGALPEVPGFDCAAASLPARGVGGDFYDMFSLQDGPANHLRQGYGGQEAGRHMEQWALLLGDASGKGVAAGLVASAVQARVHPAVLVADGPVVSRLGATGPALGLIEAGSFSAHAISLRPGAVVVAYTDGVSDALDDRGEEFGDARLEALVAASPSLAAGELCARILDEVRRHRGARQDQDDVTALVVRAR